MRSLSCVCACLLLCFPAAAEDADFTPLFNGKDLSGWVNVNGLPTTFYVRDEMIITSGKPIAFLRTEKQYENFILEVEWMHVNKTEVGNSGIFIWSDPLPAVGTPFTRGIEVQVLVNLDKEGYYTSHGDIFSIWGATCVPDRPHPNGWARCLPSERRCKGGGEWNHYRIEAKDGVIKLAVNGKEVSGVSKCKPRKGYLALESEGAECRFRNLRIKELPSSNPQPDEIAVIAPPKAKMLFNSVDFTGWEAQPNSAGPATRQVRGEKLIVQAPSKASDDLALRTTNSYGAGTLRCDFRCLDKASDGGLVVQVRESPKGSLRVQIGADRRLVVRLTVAGVGMGPLDTFEAVVAKSPLKPLTEWNRLEVVQVNDSLALVVNGTTVPIDLRATMPQRGNPMIGRTLLDLPPGRISLLPSGASFEITNLFFLPAP